MRNGDVEAARVLLFESLRVTLLRCAGRRVGYGSRKRQSKAGADDYQKTTTGCKCRRALLCNRPVFQRHRQRNLRSLGSCGSRVGAVWPLTDDAAGTRVLTLNFPFRRNDSNLALVLAVLP